MWPDGRVWVDPDPEKIEGIEKAWKRLLAAHRAVLAAEVLAHKMRLLRHEAVVELTEDGETAGETAVWIGADPSRISDMRRPPKDGKLRQALAWPVPQPNRIRAHSDPGADETTPLDANSPPAWVLDLE